MDKYVYYYNLAKAFLDQDDSDSALVKFALAKRQNPIRVEAYYARAKIHQLRGNRDHANADLTTAQNLTIISFAEFDLTKANEFVKSDAGLSLVEDENADTDDILIGKLGEIAFAKFLYKHNKLLLSRDNQLLTRADVYTRSRLNLQTSNGKSVDVKASKKSSILVREDKAPKDYYVGVQISEDGTMSTMDGFINRAGLRPSEPNIPRPCLQRKFGSLKCIGDLLEMMSEAENSAS
jgi:hypothetical protein